MIQKEHFLSLREVILIHSYIFSLLFHQRFFFGGERKYVCEDFRASIFFGDPRTLAKKTQKEDINHGNLRYPPPKATPQEIAGLMIRDYENSLVSLFSGRLYGYGYFLGGVGVVLGGGYLKIPMNKVTSFEEVMSFARYQP